MQRSAVFSFLIHLTLFGMVFFIVRNSNHFVMPSPYIVNLVGPEAATRSEGPAPKAESAPVEQNRPGIKVQQEKPKALDKSKEEYVSERIAALEAKRKIERIVKMRDVISLKKGEGEGKGTAQPRLQGKGTGSLLDDYYLKIVAAVRQHWIYPETGEKNIEAIVSMRIQKNGSLQVIGIEKSSGNPLFDRSALRAITKASPVAPPPYEMEIGVRFYP